MKRGRRQVKLNGTDAMDPRILKETIAPCGTAEDGTIPLEILFEGPLGRVVDTRSSKAARCLSSKDSEWIG